MYTVTKGSSSFNKDILRLAVPIVLQNIVTTAVNSADVIMLGFVGQNALSAGSLANQVMFILQLVYTGISSGVIMLAAQYWGKKDTKTIEHIMGIGMQLSIFISSMFFIMAFFFPHILMRIFTNDINLITEGIPYLRMVSFSYLFMSFSQVYLCAMRSIERVHFSTVTNAVALILNIIFNAVFIFGLFGAPKLGILGVALAFSMYSVIMGHLDSDIVAANAVVVVARNLGTVACFGIADAGAIILGKSIGSGNTDTIKSDSSHFVKITSMSAVVGGIVIFLLRPVFFTMADLTPTAKSYLSIMLFINMYYIVGQAFNTAMICGVFRSGGDSKWGFFCDIIDMWCYSVPLGFISAFVLKLPPMWVYFLICTDEFVKIPFVYKHYKSYKWLKNITRDF